MIVFMKVINILFIFIKMVEMNDFSPDDFLILQEQAMSFH